MLFSEMPSSTSSLPADRRTNLPVHHPWAARCGGPGPQPQRRTSGPTVTSKAPSVTRLISADRRERVNTGHGTGIALVVAALLNCEMPVLVRQCEVMDSAHSNSREMRWSSAAGSATSSDFTDQVVPMARPRNVSGSGAGSVRGQAWRPTTVITPVARKASAVESRRPQ